MNGVIVHEWIESTGGAEKVVESFTDLLSEAPLLCLWNDAPTRFSGVDVRESPLAKTLLRRNKALALPLMPLVWRHWNMKEVQWALISSHLFAHHVRFQSMPDVERFTYVHTPARYIWSPELDGRGASPIVRLAAPTFRALDRRRAREGGSFAANSEFVAKRIQDCWNIDARTIYPPVDVRHIQSNPDWRNQLDVVDRQTIDSLPSDFLLSASRLVPYKRIDSAIEAGTLSDTPVVIAGDGPDRARLESLAEEARVPVVFLGRISDELLYALYQTCVAFVFVGVEDFGIMPVEAMAAGASVIGNRLGGVSETVLDGATGALCDPDDPSDFRKAIERATGCSPRASAERSEKFAEHSFRRNIRDWLGPDRIKDENPREPYGRK